MESLTEGTIDQFQKELVRTGRSPSTARSYASDLRLLYEWLGGYDTSFVPELEDLSMEWLNEHYQSEQWSAATTNRRATTIRTYAKWAGWGSDFLDGYKPPSAAKGRPHPLPNGMDDVDRMFEQATKSGSFERMLLVVLCGKMGLRIGEAIRVRVKHVDLHGMWLAVRHGKGRREREIPIRYDAAALLRHVMTSRHSDDRLLPISDRTARRWVTELGKDADIARPVSSHDLRATAATHWYSQTKDLRTTQELLGHADSRTTELYTGINEEKMRGAINS